MSNLDHERNLLSRHAAETPICTLASRMSGTLLNMESAPESKLELLTALRRESG